MDENIKDSNKTINYHYKFIFNNGIEKDFNVRLDNKTLDLVQAKREGYPEWAELKFFKCSNCPLEEDKHKFCPIAINLEDLIEFFSASLSYEEVDVSIETEERKYIKHTSLQRGLSSLLGIYMVTSGCPIMEKLKPMVRHHLPFATPEETKYRVMSMYVLAQYFLYKRGKKPDWELTNLAKIYEDIRIVNDCFCRRLSNITIRDASLNAIVHLDIFASSVTTSIEKDTLDEIELLFNAYF